jgi:hypothetical protein
MLICITEYARHRGVSLAAVQHAVQRGRIHRYPDGMIDTDRADREWEQNTLHSNARFDQRGVPKKKREGSPPAATGHVQAGRHRVEQDAAELGSAERLASGPDFNKARAAKEIYEARIKKLDYEERLGNLVSRKSVEVEAFTVFRILRDACFNNPAAFPRKSPPRPRRRWFMSFCQQNYVARSKTSLITNRRGLALPKQVSALVTSWNQRVSAQALR